MSRRQPKEKVMSFRAPLTAPLKRLGVRGREVEVSLEAGGPVITGENQTRLDLPFSRIAKARFGFVEGRSSSRHFVRLTLTDGPEVALYAAWNEMTGFEPLAWSLADALLAHGILVETGDGPFAPVFLFSTLGPAALASAAGTVWLYVRGENWTTFLGALAVFVLLLATVGPWALSRYWPRPVNQREDLARAFLLPRRKSI
jgi:hypothetical protein